MTQRDSILGQRILEFTFFAVTLRALDASAYLAQPQSLAGALAACMHPAPHTDASLHKLACLRRIISGTGAERADIRRLLADVVETYLPLKGAEVEKFEELLGLPENEGLRHNMKTWGEQQEEIGRKMKARQDVLMVLEAKFGPVPPAIAERVQRIEDEAALDALLVRVATVALLAETGLLDDLN